MQGQGLAPGVGAGGDAVVDGGTEELLESVGGFEVEGGGFVVADQQSLPFEGARDAGGDGAQQALEFRLSRSGATVEAGPFLVERVDAIHEKHVQVDIEVQRRAESLDEGDGAGAGAGAHAQSGTEDQRRRHHQREGEGERELGLRPAEVAFPRREQGREAVVHGGPDDRLRDRQRPDDRMESNAGRQ